MPFPTTNAAINHLRSRGFHPAPDKVKHIGAWRIMNRDTMRFIYVDIVPHETQGFTYRGIAFYNDGDEGRLKRFHKS